MEKIKFQSLVELPTTERQNNVYSVKTNVFYNKLLDLFPIPVYFFIYLFIFLIEFDSCIYEFVFYVIWILYLLMDLEKIFNFGAGKCEFTFWNLIVS